MYPYCLHPPACVYFQCSSSSPPPSSVVLMCCIPSPHILSSLFNRDAEALSGKGKINNSSLTQSSLATQKLTGDWVSNLDSFTKHMSLSYSPSNTPQ